MTHEQLASRMDAAFRRQEMEHRFSAALWLLRRNPTLQRTLRAIRSRVRPRECERQGGEPRGYRALPRRDAADL